MANLATSVVCQCVLVWCRSPRNTLMLSFQQLRRSEAGSQAEEVAYKTTSLPAPIAGETPTFSAGCVPFRRLRACPAGL